MSVQLFRDDVLVQDCVSMHAAARWVLIYDPGTKAAGGGDWAGRVLRGWSLLDGRSFVQILDAAPASVTALAAEASYIRDTGW